METIIARAGGHKRDSQVALPLIEYSRRIANHAIGLSLLHEETISDDDDDDDCEITTKMCSNDNHKRNDNNLRVGLVGQSK